jgi:hypothetical protein
MQGQVSAILDVLGEKFELLWYTADLDLNSTYLAFNWWISTSFDEQNIEERIFAESIRQHATGSSSFFMIMIDIAKLKVIFELLNYKLKIFFLLTSDDYKVKKIQRCLCEQKKLLFVLSEKKAN